MAQKGKAKKLERAGALERERVWVFPSRQRGPPSDFGSLGGRQTPPKAEKPDFPETRAAHY